MTDPLWLESECVGGWLHKYKVTRETGEWVMEVCERCKNVEYFKHGADNYTYLSHHLRSALQRYHPYYNHEYGN